MRPKVLFPKSLLVRLQQARALHLPNETGGFLLGRRYGVSIDITDATFQADGDKATPASFERSSPAHEGKAIAAWEQDNMLTGLVGDWHSHPSGIAAPSIIDRSAWAVLRNAVRIDVIGLILADGDDGLFWARKKWDGIAVRQCRRIEDEGETLVFESQH